MRAFLTARHPRFALQEITVETDDAAESKPMTLALEPAKIITAVSPMATPASPSCTPRLLFKRCGPKPRPFSFFETDADGRFRMNPPSGDRYHIAAWPPPGQPYLILSRHLDWPKGALEQSLDVVMPRGVAVQGKVTEEGSGKPIAGAALSFVSRAGPRGNDGSSASTPGYTAVDGSFQLGALPGPGTLFVMGPSDDFVLQALGKPVFDTGRPAGLSTYSHANMALDLKPGVDRNDIHVTLRPGVTVTGQVVGPDDRPVRDAWIFSQIIMRPMGGSRVWHGGYHNSSARDGHFEVHGLAPDASVAVHFLEPRRKLGATAVFSGKSAAAGPVKIRLEPCATARARIVNPGGEPFVGSLPLRTLTMAVNTGPPVSAGIGKTGSLVVSRRWRPRLGRPDQLRETSGGRRRRPGRAPRLDTGRDLPLYRSRGKPRSDRATSPQGVHRQAWRDARSRRYRDRKAAAVTDRAIRPMGVCWCQPLFFVFGRAGIHWTKAKSRSEPGYRTRGGTEARSRFLTRDCGWQSHLAHSRFRQDSA